MPETTRASMDASARHSPTPEKTNITALSDDAILLIAETLCPHCLEREGLTLTNREKVTNGKSLMMLSQTCLRFYQVTRPYVYHSLYLSHDYPDLSADRLARSDHQNEARMKNILRTLSNVPRLPAETEGGTSGRVQPLDLAQAVRRLEVNLTPIRSEKAIHSEWDDSAPIRRVLWFSWLPELLDNTPRLEHLEITIEQPHDKMTGFAKALLSKAKTYDSVKVLGITDRVLLAGQSYFGSFGNLDMFLDRCPNLTVLHLRGLRCRNNQSLPPAAPELQSLTTMRIENCDLSYRQLEVLLRYCPKLKVFVYGRDVLKKWDPGPQVGMAYPDVINFLRHLTDTLEHIELDYAHESYWRRMDWLSMGILQRFTHSHPMMMPQAIQSLRHFTKLKTVRLPQDAFIGPTPWLDGPDWNPTTLDLLDDSGDDRMVRVLPTTLESLRISNMNARLYDNLARFASDASKGLYPAFREISFQTVPLELEIAEFGVRSGTRASSRVRYAVDCSAVAFWPFVRQDMMRLVDDMMGNTKATVSWSWEAMGNTASTSSIENLTEEQGVQLMGKMLQEEQKLQHEIYDRSIDWT